METVNSILFQIWLFFGQHLPYSFLLQPFIVFLFTLTVAIALFFLLPPAIRLVIYLIRHVIRFVHFVCQFFFYQINRARRTRKKAGARIILAFEDWQMKLEKNTMSLAEKSKHSGPRIRRYRKPFILTSIGLMVLVPVSYPHLSPVAEGWDDLEDWVLGERIGEYETAVAEAKQEREDQSGSTRASAQDPEPIYFQLNEEYSGGANLRTDPDINSEVIKMVRDHHTLLFLHETHDDGTREWGLVETDTGTIGWISGNVVEIKE
ncbi:SH3 domain-containing protein [Alteribacter natronophilus]|uniref:SH3 domain-containing protein n=1 Tax=Alteribacter natronophilus TaxID=2583810 RepID=UPI00110EE748|nr:SH3 domain-containing protein [Alteribacter natronophilus]TMW72303.1 SH3 domain-containing protein [Alteribacter natronophilus]